MTETLLQPVRELKGGTVLAVDGEIGSVETFYFDTTTWAIRYLVANMPDWLSGRAVLISPIAIGEVKVDHKLIYIELTREQIRNSPPIETAKSVSRQYEVEFFKYYGWPPYWLSGSSSGLPLPQLARVTPSVAWEAVNHNSTEEVHLRSTKSVKGCIIAAHDGAVGRVADFIIDTQYWVIRYLDIEADNCRPGQHVLVDPRWIACVNWTRPALHIDLTCAMVKSAPPYEPAQIIDRAYETQIFKHYRRQQYWQRELSVRYQ